jgi:hypothetical protein
MAGKNKYEIPLPPLREEDKIVLLAVNDKDAAIGIANLRLYGGGTALVGTSILLPILTITYAFYERFL